MPALIWLGANIHWLGPVVILVHNEVCAFRDKDSLGQKIWAGILVVISYLKVDGK